MFIANYLVLLPDRITLTGTLWPNPWRVSHTNTGVNQSAFFFWKKAPRRARHLNHSLLQDSGRDNIEKGLTAELTELQKAQQLLSVPSSRASSIKPAACCCKRSSPPSQIPASQPTETNTRGLWRRVNKCWEGDWFWTPIFCSQVFWFWTAIFCSQVFLALLLSAERQTAKPSTRIQLFLNSPLNPRSWDS